MSVENLKFDNGPLENTIEISRINSKIRIEIWDGGSCPHADLDHNQVHLLMLDHLEIKVGDGLKALEGKGYWYCKNCRTLHKKDHACVKLTAEQAETNARRST